MLGEKVDGGRDWVSRKLAKTINRKYRLSKKQKPNAIVVGANKRLASWFNQLKTGHCLTGQYFQWTTTPGHEMLVVPVQHPDP